MNRRPGSADRGRCRPGTRRRGFTLIEVLIALSVLGVTMTAVFSLFSAGLKLRKSTRDRMAFDREARLVVGALANDLANLVPTGPPPLVSVDSIVLWRQQRELVGGTERVGVPLMVTYQWSGSAHQDSLLVRVASPLAVDFADSTAVHQEFLRWSRAIEGADATANDLVRDDDGSRFGARATLNGMSGCWTAYPRIRAFAFGITADPDEDHGADTRSRILVRLSPEKCTSAFPGQDPLTSLALRAEDGTGMAVGFWLPRVAKKPLPKVEGLSPEVQP